MSILNLENVGRLIGERVILTGVTAGMEDTDRIGVIGVNGAGKSTLLAIASGDLEPDEGCVVKRNGLRISYLKQNPAFDPAHTVLEDVCRQIRGKADHWDTEGEARAMLRRFGIDNPDCSAGTLSGGQKKRAALAAAVLTPCDLLILDEPTNHLDHEMIEWLQDWLESFPGALLMVTHDRYFLDEVTDRIWELDRGKLYDYEASYSGYLEKKQERLNFAIAAERKMAALYKKDLAWMMRGARARTTKQKAHIQRFEALRDREKITEEKQVEMSSASVRLGGKTVELKNVSKQYGGRVLFRDFSCIFLRNDRIGIIGPNGCGKSTLMRVIMGLEQPDSGTVSVGQTVKFGYFSQENEYLDESERVLDYVKSGAEFIRTEKGLVSASSMCERFLFDSRMQYTPIGKLSGGEKRRLYLLRVLVESPNVLILDEPTNDLDIQTLQILEDYLDHFSGIVIAVSHDRYFLDRVVHRIFSFEKDGTLRQSEGGYEEFRQRELSERAAQAAEGREKAAGKNVAPGGKNAVPGGKNVAPGGKNAVPGGKNVAPGGGNTAPGGKNAVPAGKSTETAGHNAETAETAPSAAGRAHRKKNQLTYREQREYNSLEEEIDALTKRSEELGRAMEEAATDFVKLDALNREKEAADALLEEKMERYFALQEKLESLQNS